MIREREFTPAACRATDHEGDPQGLTAAGGSDLGRLMAAAGSGDVDRVRRLLERGADPTRRSGHGDAAIHWAAEEGHQEVVELLLSHDARMVDLHGSGDRTPLMAAAAAGHADLVAWLLERGADPGQRDSTGTRALDWAAQEGRHAVVEALLAHDRALLDLPGYRERTALMAAAGNGHHELVRRLLALGADPARRMESGEAALHWAAEEGHPAVVELLLGQDATLADLPGYGERTALIAAACHGHVEVVDLLLARGADPLKPMDSGETALHGAAEAGHEAVAERLLAHEPRLLDRPGYRQRTALIAAAANGHLELVRRLLERGADPRCRTESGEGALHWAVRQGFESVVERLLEHDRELLDLPGAAERTALMAAAANGRVELVRRLLALGADPRKRMASEDTALHWAADDGHLAVVELLLAHDPALLDWPGAGQQTALMAAAGSGHVAIVNLLLRRGADAAKRMESGESALHRAADEGHAAVVGLLLAHDLGLLDLPGAGERTALIAAAGSGHLGLVRSLLRMGADPRKRESDGTRALDWAAQQGEEAVVEALLDHDPQLLDLPGFRDRTALTAAAGNGHVELVRLLLARGANPAVRMINGTRPLDWAAQQGHRIVVEQLLARDPQLLDLPGFKDRTALMVAAGSGHVELARVLLERGADPRKLMSHDESALHWVAEAGHLPVAELLLAHDPELLDLAGFKERTALMVAAGNGHVELVQWLLAHGADPRRRMSHGETALHWAAEAGHLPVVQALIAHDRQLLDAPGGGDRTALMAACSRDHLEMVTWLLEQGADPRRRESDGTRALDWAAQQGHHAIVEQLLARDPALLDLPGFMDRTALIAACGNGHVELLRSLLTRGADPGRRMDNGESAIHWAAEEGHEEIVAMLLARNARLLELPGGGERTALIAAAANGHLDLVSSLLARGANPRKREADGARALDWAAQQGHAAVVERLLAHDGELLDLPGFKNRTALIAAAGRGDIDLVRSLLARGADVARRMSNGTRALDWAAQQGHRSVVELLLAHDSQLLDLPGFRARTALIAAAGNGHVELLKALLQRGADPTRRVENGESALHWAAEVGHLAVVQVLLAHTPALLDSPGRGERTALIAASGRGHDEVVRVLLERGADPRRREADGTRALDWAAQEGHQPVVELLLERDPALLDLPGYRGRTALIAAAGNGHVELVRLLLKHGADPRKKMAGGETALHFAASQGHEVIVQLLLGRWIRPRPR